MFIFICSCTIVSGQYYGMKFSGNEVSLDQRSGLNLTPERALKIKEKLELEFYLRFKPYTESQFGYIFRLIVGNRNIDLIYGIITENPNNFELILGDNTSKIAFHVPIEELTNDWIKLRFEFDFKNHQISCHVNNKVFVDNLTGFDNKNGFKLMFGAHSFGNYSATDVPGMILRDVKMSMDNHTTYRWPLNETIGTIAHSVPKGNNGVAFNPGWLLKHHNTWNRILDMDIAGAVKTTFDPRKDELYIVSTDSVYIFNIRKNSLRILDQNSPFPMNSPNEIIFDTISNRLLLYSLDDNYLSVFDFETREWSPHDSSTTGLTVYWHHNRFIVPDGFIVTFGGYGEFMYKNSVLVWNPEKSSFASIRYKGEFHPRYLAGSGFNPLDSLYYIIGGYGSKSGKQSESPDYYHEILSFSLKDCTFSHVFEFPDEEAGFCFANSIVFDDSNNMYALYFSKYQSNNKLQMIRIPLENPEIIELGNPIDYSFLDINSFADLHFNKESNSLIAISSYSSDDSTMVSIHSITFPPQKFSIEVTADEKGNLNLVHYFIAALILIVTAYLLFYRRKDRSVSEKKPLAKSQKTINDSKKNSIILFGGFQVFDKKGKDITGQFTPLPKKLFLFILLHSLYNDKGVSSDVLYETFWFDKSVENARNNRAVNIVKLRSLLENLETASISKETGYWKFDFDLSRIHIDYLDYLRIIRRTNELTRNHIVDLLSITENKPFLSNTNAAWIDPFKSEISNNIIDTFLRYIDTSDDNPEFLLHLTNGIFIFDAVNEEALKIQCRLLITQGKHNLAKKAYSRFIGEYKLLYDEEYNMSFKQIIEK